MVPRDPVDGVSRLVNPKEPDMKHPVMINGERCEGVDMTGNGMMLVDGRRGGSWALRKGVGWEGYRCIGSWADSGEPLQGTGKEKERATPRRWLDARVTYERR